MEEMPISKFKATCLAVLKRVKRTGKPILVTRFGEPVAEIVPPAKPKPKKSWIGSMNGTAKILGDIVGPISDIDEWEAAKEE